MFRPSLFCFLAKMGSRTRREKLFGAACLRLKLADSSGSAGSAASEIYEAVLHDLGLSDDEVAEFLRENATEVRRALSRRDPK